LIRSLRKRLRHESGTISFKIFDQYIGSGSLFASDETAAAYYDTLREVTVDALTLDDYFTSSQEINLIRIDAGGQSCIYYGERKESLIVTPELFL
jgi:hypothetical protein